MRGSRARPAHRRHRRGNACPQIPPAARATSRSRTRIVTRPQRGRPRTVAAGRRSRRRSAATASPRLERRAAHPCPAAVSSDLRARGSIHPLAWTAAPAVQEARAPSPLAAARGRRGLSSECVQESDAAHPGRSSSAVIPRPGHAVTCFHTRGCRAEESTVGLLEGRRGSPCLVRGYDTAGQGQCRSGATGHQQQRVDFSVGAQDFVRADGVVWRLLRNDIPA
jgi:hypothetical protein